MSGATERETLNRAPSAANVPFVTDRGTTSTSKTEAHRHSKETRSRSAPVWVAATSTRNFMLANPLLDWLGLWGEAKGFERDTVDKRTDFGLFILRKGTEFEQAVMNVLGDALPFGNVYTVESQWMGVHPAGSEQALSTWEAMNRGEPVISQGLVWDDSTRTFGFPDLLFRSDVFAQMFPGVLNDEQVARPAAKLGIGNCHYVVLDIKYSTLRLLASGLVSNAGSFPAYKTQVFIYNRALAQLQGYCPPAGFLLGRGWSQQTRTGGRSDHCLERLGAVCNNEKQGGRSLGERSDEAAAWVRRVRAEGGNWDALPEPTVPQLRPNPKATTPGMWKTAVKRITVELEDLIVLYGVGAKKRNAANEQKLFRWTDRSVTPGAFNMKGVTAGRLDAFLDVNRDIEGPPVRPARIAAAREEWHDASALEFYVDFETVSDLNDDFSEMPLKGGETLVFMIGCGHVEQGQWKFECFTSTSLTVGSEGQIIEEWFAHMNRVADRFAPNGSDPVVFHWSAHETVTLETAYNAAAKRHPSEHWPQLKWFDFLNRVARAEPLVVRGAHGFGLKAVTNALHQLGLVNIQWGAGPADGLGAMVGAWWSQQQVDSVDGMSRLSEVELMQQIGEYNEIDCKAMMEIVSYLRARH